MTELLRVIQEREIAYGPYDRSDAARDTDSSESDVSGAWHDARTDAEESGYLDRGSDSGSGGYGGQGSESSGTHSNDLDRDSD